MIEGRIRRAHGTVAGAVWLFGLAGFAASVDLSPTSPHGAFAFGLLTMNQVGALMTGVLATIALFGVAMKNGDAVVGAGAGFAGAAVIQLFQVGRATNWFGGNGGTVALLTTAAVGLLILSFPPRQPS
jgi:hypothetical protein